MKFIRWSGTVIAILLLACVGFLWYMGFFNALKVSEQEAGPYTYAYERFVGPYWKTGKIFQKVEGMLKADGVIPETALGVYHDNPELVAKEMLRSDCGFVIAKKDLPKVPDLKKKYSVATMQKKMNVIVEFPLKNKLSYMLGPMKAYPELRKYAQEKGYTMAMTYELYEKDKILFIMEIVK